jgi:hypothetical protein
MSSRSIASVPWMAKQKPSDAQIKQNIFQCIEMFPALSIDYVTSVFLSVDGDFDKALPMLVAEHEIVVERDRLDKIRLPSLKAHSPSNNASSPSSAPAVQRISDDALESTKSKISNDKHASNNNNDKSNTVNSSSSTSNSTSSTTKLEHSTNASSAGASKHEQYEAVVRQLCESFPHVPLDDVWTAVITCRGNRVDASARLLSFEQPGLENFYDLSEFRENTKNQRRRLALRPPPPPPPPPPPYRRNLTRQFVVAATLSCTGISSVGGSRGTQ